MNTLCILGWLLAAFLLVLFLGARRATRDWRRIYDEQNAKICDLERQVLAGVQADPDGLKWYREEHARLSRKCEAICRAVRRRKGRGKATVECHPVYNF